MAKKVLVDLDMNHNQLIRPLFWNSAGNPSTLVKGLFWIDTTSNTPKYYNGTIVKDFGIEYSEGTGIDITNNVISVDFDDVATAAQGALADTSIQPNDRISLLSNDAGYITSADLPTVPTKISDLTDDTATYPIDKADTLTGLTSSISELNILDGVTVTASDINSVTSKIGLTNLSINSGSSNYLGYDNTTGKFSAKVDTTVTASSSKLITSGAVDTAIKNAISNVYKAQGTVAFASLPTLSSSIEGYVYNVSDAFTTTANFVEGAGKSYPAGTNVVCINTSGSTYKWDVLAGSIDTSTFITESGTNTLTNKTIDADNNTISDLTTSNFKSGTVVTSVGATGFDSALPTEKAVRSAINAIRYSTSNGALTQSGGLCTWTVTHNLGTKNVQVTVYETSSGDEVIVDSTRTSTSVVTVKINSSSNISAGTYTVVVQGF